MLGKINKIETFGSVDGPGIRFVVFMQGCPMRCLFCHNPETWNINGENAFEIEASDLLKRALRYKAYWGIDGGITVSGGEPLLQTDFLIEFFTLAHQASVHTCLDTSGILFSKTKPYFSKFKALTEVTDLFLLDIKHIDNEEHKKLTGKSNDNVLEMFCYLDSIKKPVWVRHVLVPGLSDNDFYLQKTRDFVSKLSNVYRIEVLPYHAFALGKYKELGIHYPLENTNAPSEERIQNANRILETDKYKGWQKV